MVDTSILLFGGCRWGWKLFAIEKPMMISSHLRQHHCTGKMWDGSCSSPNWSWRRVQGSILVSDQDDFKILDVFLMDWSGNWHFKSLSSSKPQQVVAYIYIFHTQHISIMHSLLFYDIHHRSNCIWIFTTVTVKTRALRHLHGSELRPGYLPGRLLSALPQSWGIALKMHQNHTRLPSILREYIYI